MEEYSKEIVEIVAGKALEPVTDVIETAFGIGGLDWLREVRKRNADTFARRTKRIFEERNIKDATPPEPSILIPLITAAENEGREELLDLWARLLAAASDPKRTRAFRRDYIEIVKQFEPIDAIVLNTLYPMSGRHDPTRIQHIEGRFSFHRDQILVSFGKLKSLDLIEGMFVHGDQPTLTPLGRQLMQVLNP